MHLKTGTLHNHPDNTPTLKKTCRILPAASWLAISDARGCVLVAGTAVEIEVDAIAQGASPDGDRHRRSPACGCGLVAGTAVEIEVDAIALVIDEDSDRPAAPARGRGWNIPLILEW